MTNNELLERQKWFVNLRFGQFIHFNSATQQFCDKNWDDWEYGVENRGEARAYPFDETTWNPYKLDCNQWAEASKALGVRFAALTAKHHEGFCLWNTNTTEHSVKNASCKRDVVKEYLRAYRNAGITAGLYFSILDLTHEIGRHKCTRADVDYTKAQFRELLTNYGEIPFIIIDGWQANWGGPLYEYMSFEEIDCFVKSLQPQCLLINHSCETNLDHTDVVFYENAAGQNAPDEFIGPGAAGNIITNHWFWKETDPVMELKSSAWVCEKGEQLMAKNVSFLLNMSPNKYGLVDDNMLQRFTEIGKRLKIPAPVKDIPFGWQKRK